MNTWSAGKELLVCVYWKHDIDQDSENKFATVGVTMSRFVSDSENKCATVGVTMSRFVSMNTLSADKELQVLVCVYWKHDIDQDSENGLIL